MAQSDARFAYRAKLARTDHDLSRPFGFTCAPGMELPVFYDLATPGDAYYIKHDLTYLRTAPLASPAMVDVKVHFETFFVPFQMIYEPIENVVYQLKNQRSSLYSLQSMMGINFPLMDYSHFVSNVCNTASIRETNAHADAFRLADHFRLNPENFAQDSDNPAAMDYAPNNFPWQILAYNTIWQYYFRLDDKSQFDNSVCNWDKYYNQSTPVVPDNWFFTIFQRPWDFDYYTSMYKGPIVSQENMQSILPRGQYADLLNNITQPIKDSNSDTASNPLIRAFSSFASSDNLNGAFSTVMIRQMFANEKLAMITGRTKKTYDAQVLAHLGVEVPHDVKHDISCIGRTTFDIHIGEVTSLASTESTPLGELAGKGWSMGQGKQFKFTAPCHGVIMTLFCVEPKQRYYGGFDRLNKLVDVNDIPQPEYDRLGNVPVFRHNLGPSGNASTTLSDIVGWKERYYWNKRRAPQVTLAFMHGSRSTGTNNYETYMIANRPNQIISSGTVYSRPDIERTYYIPRSAMDSLMLVNFYEGWKVGTNGDENWNKTPWLAYARDPFIVDSYVKVKKVSWLSKDGEPIYNV